MSVVCLEQGDWPDYSQAPSRHPDYELTAGQYWGWDPNVRGGARRLSDRRLRVRHHGADVERRGRRHGRLRRALAAQHAVRLPRPLARRRGRRLAADATRSSSPTTCGSSATWASPAWPATPPSRPARDRRMPPVPLAPMGRRVARAHNELGWHWWPGPNAIATRRYGALQAVRAARHLPVGLRRRRQGDRRPHHWPRQSSAGVELRIGARACAGCSCATTGWSRAPSTSTRTATSTCQRAGVTIVLRQRHRHAAAAVPLAATTAASPTPPGWSGKRLMMHPFGTVTGLFDEDLESWQGVWGQHIHSLEFYETDESRGFLRGAKWGLQPTGGPLVDDPRLSVGRRERRLGRRLPRRACGGASGTRRCGASSPRTCPRRPTGSCSTRVSTDALRHPGVEDRLRELRELADG